MASIFDSLADTTEAPPKPKGTGSIFDDLGEPETKPATAPAGEIPRGSPYTAPAAVPQAPPLTAGRVAGKVGEAAVDLVDMAISGVPAMLLGTIGEVTQRLSGLADGRGYREGAKAGAEFSRSMGERFGRPLYDNLKAAGVIKGTETSLPQQAMEKIGGWLEHAATVVEHDSKGVISKEDYLASVNGFMAAMGVKGLKAMTQGALNKVEARGTKNAWDSALERFDAEEQLARAKFEEGSPNRTAAKAAAEQPAVDPLYGGDFAAQAAARREAFLRRKAYEKDLSNFPPSGERTGSRGPVDLTLEGKETPTTYSGNQPFSTADQTAGLKRGVVSPSPIETEGALRPAARPALDSGLEKAKGGRLFDMTMEERLAVKNSVDITDPKVITAAAVGATGLGLAMMYEPSAEEAAMAIGAGALLRRGGEGLPMRELLAKPEATPLGALLESSAYTTSTIEKLVDSSPGKFEFRKTAVEQLLKREGVTKHERDLMTAALAEVPRDTITAKELMVGLKLAAKDFELTPMKSTSHADYGLERIDRKTPPTEWDQQGAWIPEETAPEDIPRVTAEFQAEIARQLEEAASATTRVYRSPLSLGSNNHFQDPNYFAHTRSFVEDGVRHVVELQSDLAQKAGKVLKPEERAKLTERQARLEDTQTKLSGALQRWDDGKASLAEMREKLLPLREVIEDATSFDGPLPEAIETVIRRARTALNNTDMNLAETKAKLTQEGLISTLAPMLKDWHKRLVREEIADAERARGQTQNLIAEKQRAIAAYEAELRQTSGGIPQEWVGANSLTFRRAAGILRGMAEGLHAERLTEASVADKMRRIEGQLPPEAQAKWKEYYENYADEAGGFLHPTGDEVGGVWGQKYAAAFPSAMADFFDQAVGKQDSRAAKEYLAGLREDIARLEEQAKPAIRFATADTVAKVEGWPEQASLKDQIAYLQEQAELARGLKDEWEAKGYERQIEKLLAAPPPPRFRPEHQGIYDRYSRDVEKFLRQLGGKPYTDSAGHTWLEVPLGEQQKALPGGGARTQIGGVDPALAKAVGLVGGSAALAWMLSRDKDKAKHAAMAGVLTGLGLLAYARNAPLRGIIDQTIHGVQQVAGNLSTDKAVSAPLLRRFTEHARAELKNIHDSGRKISPFLEIASKVPDAARAQLNVALANGRTSDIVAAIGSAATPGLLKAWNEVQLELKAMGTQLKDLGLIKDLRQDYFPRIVKDVPGLLTKLGKEAVPLQRALNAAEKAAGGVLDEAERSAIVNKFLEKNLRSGGVGGKASFFKRRTIDNVTIDLEPFYVEPLQALPLYMASAVRAIEKAKFFGKDAVRDPVTGKLHLEGSIGNVVNAEIASGQMSPENFNRLTKLLETRFGPAYAAPARPLRALSQVTNIALLGNVFSGMMNLADIGGIMAQQGILSTVSAVVKKYNKTHKITAADVGMADHIMEEFVYGTREPVRVGVPLSQRTVQLSLAKAVDKTFKFSGFKAFDQVMKEVHLNAAMENYSRMSRSKAGEAKIIRQYGDYFTTDMPQLLADLRSGAKTKLTTELAFRELSDAQPITKIEMPQFYLDHPNLRYGYALKSFAIKQLNLVKKRGVDEIAKGNVRDGMGFLIRYALLAGSAGAGMDWIIKSMLGRDADTDWGVIPFNVLKNIGISEYAIDRARQGKGKEAILMATVPPMDPVLNIVTADPKAVRYFPLVGRLVYDRAMDGAEKANAAKKLAEKKKAADARRTPEERRELERRALERRKALTQ